MGACPERELGDPGEVLMLLGSRSTRGKIVTLPGA